MARILVIDDQGVVRIWAKRVLSSAGHEVLLANNGKDGLKTLREAAVDLVITDIYMPEQDGLEVIREARVAAPKTKLIAMSARQSVLNMFKVASALGASATLQKPFGAQELVEAVSRVLAGDYVGR